MTSIVHLVTWHLLIIWSHDIYCSYSHMTSIVHIVTWHLLFIWSHDIYCSSGHMTSIVHLVTLHLFFCPSWRGILLCSLLKGSSHFSPWRGFFYFLGVFPDLIWGQRSGMLYTDCKALWGEFVMCDIGLYKIKWIELNKWSTHCPSGWRYGVLWATTSACMT